MHLVATAVVPIVLLLSPGTVLRRRFAEDPAFWRGSEWLSYRVSTPALTSPAQAGIRVNTYTGLVFATALHGDAGVAAFALATAVNASR